MIEQGPTQIIRIHYPDQYPFSPKNLGQASCEGMPAFVGRPMLICSLASSIIGERSLPKRLNHRAGLSPTLVTMATNGRGGSCRWMEHRGRAGPGGCSQGCYVLGITQVAGRGGWMNKTRQHVTREHKSQGQVVSDKNVVCLLRGLTLETEGLWIELMFCCSQYETGLLYTWATSRCGHARFNMVCT